MIKSLLIQLFKAAHALVKRKLEERTEKSKREKVLSKFGWDCVCPGCKGWMHTHELVQDFQETDMHWHYRCVCGATSSWRLDMPCPMFDPSFDARTLARWPGETE